MISYHKCCLSTISLIVMIKRNFKVYSGFKEKWKFIIHKSPDLCWAKADPKPPKSSNPSAPFFPPLLLWCVLSGEDRNFLQTSLCQSYSCSFLWSQANSYIECHLKTSIIQYSLTATMLPLSMGWMWFLVGTCWVCQHRKQHSSCATFCSCCRQEIPTWPDTDKHEELNRGHVVNIVRQ